MEQVFFNVPLFKLEPVFKGWIRDVLKEEQHKNVAPIRDNQQTDLLTIKQASQLLGLSIPTIYSKVSKRELPFSKPAGAKRLYFSRMELMALISKGRVKTADEVYSEAGSNMNIKKGGCNG